MRIVLLPAALLLSTACASSAVAPAAPDAVPTPYSAEAIRAALPDGSRIVFRVVAGGATSRMTMSFADADADGVTVATAVTSEEGESLAPTTTETATWEELRDHARFPAGSVVRIEASISVPAGTIETWLYTVLEDDGSVSRYYFALDSPGPPVRTETIRDGVTVFAMELVERS